MTSSKKLRPRTAWLGTIGAPLAALAALALQPSGAQADPLTSFASSLPLWQATTNRIDGLAVEELDDGTTVLRLRGSAKPTFNVYRLKGPDRLVVDLASSDRGKVVPHIPLDTWACGRVTVDAVAERGTRLVRVVVELKREASYIVVPDGAELVVTVTPRDAAPEAYFARKSAVKRKAELEAERREVSALKSQARKLTAVASKRVKAAEGKASAAAHQAEAARKAADAARKAERRAQTSELEAQSALKDAKSHRFRARRLVKQAAAEREQAQQRREQAEKKLRLALDRADARRVEAQRVLESAQAVAKQRLADAASTNAQAKRTLADAKTNAANTAAVAERELARALAEAASTRAAAKAELQDAHGAKAKAQRELAAAKTRASAARAQAERDLDEAQTVSAAKEKVANKRLAAAKAAAAEAREAAKSTDAATKKQVAKAERDAKKRLRTAEKELAAERKTAKAKLRRAQVALTDARTAAKATEAQAARRLKDARTAEEAAKVRAAAIIAKAQVDAKARLKRARTEAKAVAQRQLDEAKVEAAKLVKQAKDDAEALRTKRFAEAEAAAKRMVTKAAKDARRNAETQQRSAVSAAKRKLVTANKQGDKQAVVTAKSKLASLKAGRSGAVKDAVAQARTQAKSNAASELARARKQIEAEASKQVALAKATARAAQQRAESVQDEANKKLAQADKKLAAAHREQQAARKLHNDAKGALATAETAKSHAQAEQLKAAKARRASEAQLAEAEREAGAARKRGRVGRALKRKIKLAEKARDQAVAREASASATVAKLQNERTGLSRKLAKRDAEVAELKQKVAAVEASALAQARTAAAQRAAATGTTHEPDKHTGPRVNDVLFESDAHEERVIVRFDGPANYEGQSLTPTVSVLKFKGAGLRKQLERSLDATAYQGPIKVITSFAEGDDAKIIVSTTGPSKPRLEQRDGEVIWHFPRTKASSRPAEAIAMAGSKVGGFNTAAAPMAAMAPVGAFGQADVTRRGRRSGRGRWRGERIDIELQEAPIKDVLLLFSDIGRVNIVAGNGVEGVVTMKLNSVPWDQALDIILRSLSLGSIREGNVIRVATLSSLDDERRSAIERANARVQLKPLETKLVPVSYATAEEMVAKVQTVLSPRGTVTPDSRTNQLIIMDVSENIALAEELIRSLDTQTPQVLIEARIVEARTNFTRQLGIQWGFDFAASPGTGNPTGLLFPNSIGIGGGGTGSPVDSRGLILPGAAANPNYAVDLPAPVGTGAGGAVGFSFGSISGNLNTNLRLSAAESTGEVRIISAPKIVTLDNSEAQIEQGVQIPISQVSAQGVNTRFVNATLSLEVTPHVTNEGAILLDVTVQKNEADFVNTGARGDPTILTKQAESRMLVNDSDTAVIGGIYTRNKAVNYTKIPWLAEIPIVGWFFKNKTEADTRSEVLIFITPKIVNRASSIGG